MSRLVASKLESSEELDNISALPLIAFKTEQRLVTESKRTLWLAMSQPMRCARLARKEERWVAVGEVLLGSEESREEEERKCE